MTKTAPQNNIDGFDSTYADSLNGQTKEYTQLLTFYLDGQFFGIPVIFIKDIFKATKITKVPLASEEIAGVVNLRGHIVTAINLRHKLNLKPRESEVPFTMNIAVDYKSEMYSFVVDSVSEVMTLHQKDFEGNPATLDDKMKDLSLGIYKLEKELLIVLDVKKLIGNLD